jgi:hypothetical protein
MCVVNLDTRKAHPPERCPKCGSTVFNGPRFIAASAHYRTPEALQMGMQFLSLPDGKTLSRFGREQMTFRMIKSTLALDAWFGWFREREKEIRERVTLGGVFVGDHSVDTMFLADACRRGIIDGVWKVHADPADVRLSNLIEEVKTRLAERSNGCSNCTTGRAAFKMIDGRVLCYSCYSYNENDI